MSSASLESSHVFGRATRLELPEISAGDGCYLIDTTGRKYLDACGGAAVSCLGHSDVLVREAIKSQVDGVAFAHTGFFTSRASITLADKLIANAPDGIEKVYFVSGGSEAMEAALKLTRQYFLEIGQPQRRNFYRTLAELSRQYAWRAGSRWQQMAPRTL